MIKITPLLAPEWKKFSENAHLVVFKAVQSEKMERIDFALLATRGDDVMGYVTCRELDQDTLYWQFGGTFPGARKTSLSYQVYTEGLNWCKGKYKRVSTLIENNNFVMLKFAMKAGFVIRGLRVHRESLLLEHILEWRV